jgi:hypothetical protein
VENLGKPYSQCEDNLSQSYSSLYRAFNGQGKYYRRKDCLDFMIQRYAADNCDCIFNNLITGDDGKKYCELNDFLSCLNKTENRFNGDQFLDNCPLECNQTDYEVSVLTSSATSLGYLKEYAEYNYEGQYSQNFNPATSAYVVNVYFSELGYTQIVGVPNYTPISLISNIGGTLGLFLGMSLLSFIEIVDLIIQMILTPTKSRPN